MYLSLYLIGEDAAAIEVQESPVASFLQVRMSKESTALDVLPWVLMVTCRTNISHQHDLNLALAIPKRFPKTCK